MNTDSSSELAPAQKPKVAILLYGHLRTFQLTKNSFRKHVADYLDADVFYFGPVATDQPKKGYGPRHKTDILKDEAENKVKKINPEDLLEAYGERLKAYHLHEEPPETFAEMAKGLSRKEWFLNWDPARLFSMAFNIEGVYKLLETYQEKTGIEYDVVVLTRPDLVFYKRLWLNINPREVYIPNSPGFLDPQKGTLLKWNSHVLFYKNMKTGDLIPSGLSFCDHIIALHAKHAKKAFEKILESFRKYAAMRVPLSPETMFYFHLITRCRWKLVKKPWVYEIARFGAPTIMNFSDIYAGYKLDPKNPKLRKKFHRPLLTPFIKVYRVLRHGLWRLTRL